MTYLATLSDEERQEAVRQAQLVRAANREAGISYAHANLKLDWMDEPYWKELASKHGARRFQWYEPANAKNIRKALRKVGKDSLFFKDTFGFASAEDHWKANPKMTANAFLGFCLEQIEEERFT